MSASPPMTPPAIAPALLEDLDADAGTALGEVLDVPPTGDGEAEEEGFGVTEGGVVPVCGGDPEEP